MENGQKFITPWKPVELPKVGYKEVDLKVNIKEDSLFWSVLDVIKNILNQSELHTIMPNFVGDENQISLTFKRIEEPDNRTPIQKEIDKMRKDQNDPELFKEV
jgi:hypothetical protein